MAGCRRRSTRICRPCSPGSCCSSSRRPGSSTRQLPSPVPLHASARVLAVCKQQTSGTEDEHAGATRTDDAALRGENASLRLASTAAGVSQRQPIPSAIYAIEKDMRARGGHCLQRATISTRSRQWCAGNKRRARALGAHLSWGHRALCSTCRGRCSSSLASTTHHNCSLGRQYLHAHSCLNTCGERRVMLLLQRVS